eukprot:4948851-Amphidinium_carterae.1
MRHSQMRTNRKRSSKQVSLHDRNYHVWLRGRQPDGPDPGPLFRSRTKFASNQEPEPPHSLGNSAPVLRLFRGFVLCMLHACQPEDPEPRLFFYVIRFPFRLLPPAQHRAAEGASRYPCLLTTEMQQPTSDSLSPAPTFEISKMHWVCRSPASGSVCLLLGTRQQLLQGCKTNRDQKRLLGQQDLFLWHLFQAHVDLD